MTTDLSASATQILQFMQSEGGKEHSADEFTALLSLPRPDVDAALAELKGAGLLSSQMVSGYGQSAEMWGLAVNPATD